MPHTTRFFFFTRARNKRPLLRIHKRLSTLYPLQGGEGGIASLDDLTKNRTTPYGIDPRCDARKAPSTFPALLPRAFYARRQRPLFVSDAIAARSAPRGGQTQAGRTSEPTASPYHNKYNDRRGEPALRAKRRPAATQGGKVILCEGAKLTQRHEIRRENTATHRDASARCVLRDGRAYAAASCHVTQKSRTTSASSEGFGKVGIGQGLKTGTRRSRCNCSKASPDSALLIQRVRFLRKFPSSSRSSVICEENDNGVRAPYGLRQHGPATPTREIRHRYNMAQPVRPLTSGSHIATGTPCPYQQTPVHGKCLLPRPLASRKSLAALRHVMPRGAGRCLRQSRDAIAKRDTTRRGTGAPCTIVHDALRVLTSPHRKQGARPYACATTPRDSSQSRPAFRSMHTHPQQHYH